MCEYMCLPTYICDVIKRQWPWMGHTHSFFISECIPGVNQEGNLGRTDPKLWLFSFSYAKILSPVPLVKFK